MELEALVEGFVGLALHGGEEVGGGLFHVFHDGEGTLARRSFSAAVMPGRALSKMARSWRFC